MVRNMIKRDRTARLLRLQMMLCQKTNGLDIKEISRLCSTSLSTAYRDVKALENELEVPIWENGSKRGIDKSYFLPPINFTLMEAMNMFLAARVLNVYFHEYHPSIFSAFLQLSSKAPPGLQKKINDVLNTMQKLPRNDKKVRNFNKLTQAWLSQHPVTITYQDIYDDGPTIRTIDPYLIEPGIRGRTIYFIAYCHLLQSVHVFNMDCILGEVEIKPDTFEIPDEFDADRLLFTAWRTFGHEETITTKLHFSKKISRYIALTSQHPSQKVEELGDGSVNLILVVSNTHDFRSWIMSWGNEVEVLEPKKLRQQIGMMGKLLSDIYSKEDIVVPSRDAKTNIDSIQRKKFTEISDEQWNLILPLLPPHPEVGRPRANDRRTINGILWILNNKARWSDLPRNYGAPSTCHVRFQTWQKMGIWPKIWEALTPKAK